MSAVRKLEEALREQWPRDSTPALTAFYGNPVGYDGGASPVWEKANLCRLSPPYLMFRRGGPLSIITIHRKCYDSLERILKKIKRQYTEKQLQFYELNVCGDAYNFGRARGSFRLSTHAYGCAFDISPLLGEVPIEVVAFFEEEHWTWGGPSNSQHFQATTERYDG
jgi:hypothetical protein